MSDTGFEHMLIPADGTDPQHYLKIGETLLQKWQQIIDLMASITNVSATMLMRVQADGKEAEVVATNQDGENPLKPSMRLSLTSETYCYYVMRERRMIHVPDSAKDDRWETPPLGMRAYVGVPLLWPDGTLFGSMCIMNRDPGAFSDAVLTMLEQFRLAIEADLKSLLDDVETRRMREQLTLAQRIARVGDWHWDVSNDRFEASPVLYEMCGLPVPDGPLIRESAINLLLQIVHPDYHDELRQDRFFEGEAFRLFRIMHPELGERWVRGASVHTEDGEGKLLMVRGTIQDITDEVRNEQQAREAAVEQERTRMLVRFVRDLAHEIKTPLSVMETSLYIMRHSDDPQRNAQHAQRLHEQIITVSDMIDALTKMARLDVLDISTRAEVDPAVITREAVSAVRMRNRDRAIAVYEDIPQSLDKICAHESELANALINIIDNAFRYTLDGGSIRVSAHAVEGAVRIAIRDTGFGMDARLREHIFDRFYRGDPARTTRGLGMGLPIALKVIEIHDGVIEVDSTPGDGSTFTVVLPTGNIDT